MTRTPHLAHPAGAQAFLQTVAPQFTCARDLRAETVDHAGADVRQQNDEQVWQHEDEKEPERIDRRHNGGAARDAQADHNRDRAHRDQRGNERPARRTWDDDRVRQHPDRDPRQTRPRRRLDVASRVPVLRDGDPEAPDHFEDETERERRADGNPPDSTSMPRRSEPRQSRLPLGPTESRRRMRSPAASGITASGGRHSSRSRTHRGAPVF